MNTPPNSLPEEITQPLFCESTFMLRLTTGTSPIPLYKQTRERAMTQLNQWFREGRDIETLIHAHTWFIDQLLITAWKQLSWHATPDVALLAVGGYGRGELHPGSDIDILILSGGGHYQNQTTSIEAFLTLLWDIGLKVGSSVRSVNECSDEARNNLSIITNLMESRSLVGSTSLFNQLQDAISVDKMWPSKTYLQAKFDEQQIRHKKYQETEYSVEPNLKGSPGGLRDLHMLTWVARRHFGTENHKELTEHNFLTCAEYGQLMRCRAFLWRVRWALHTFTGRSEDRLLFDHQQNLAEQFGYKNQRGSLAVEQFMQSYFRTVIVVAQLKDLILQHFDDEILSCDKQQNIIPINERFQLRNQYLEVTHDGVFDSHPPAVLEMFMLMTLNRHIQGAQAETIRLLRNDRHRVDDTFRKDPRCTKLFMQILQAPYNLTITLRRMARYGILERYLPEFGQIIGQMQFDLFHIYTVDAHTLLLIKYLRSFSYKEDQVRYPIASKVIQDIRKPELLYIAGLYHDIGKGRGGDHSLLGAADADIFCRRHNLRKIDTKLVCWLVKEHLLLSVTAQKTDLSDPEVIQHFARKVGNINNLNHLYLLTVADINATNPELWNGWRSSLIQQLYTATRRMMEDGIENLPDTDEMVQDVQETALALLATINKTTTNNTTLNINENEAIKNLWQTLDEDYFTRHEPHEIAWHTQAILKHDTSAPLVMTRAMNTTIERGGSQIFIYTQDRANLFSALVTGMAQLYLSIQDARIITSASGFSLDTFTVLEEDGTDIGDDTDRIEQICHHLQQVLSTPEHLPELCHRRTPRQLRHFARPPVVTISSLPGTRKTLLEITATDRPGLLAKIGKTFADLDLQVHNAKIATFGEKVEDSFYITNHAMNPISDPSVAKQVCDTLTRVLKQASEEDAIVS